VTVESTYEASVAAAGETRVRPRVLGEVAVAASPQATFLKKRQFFNSSGIDGRCYTPSLRER
jgi:hypothetical protein